MAGNTGVKIFRDFLRESPCRMAYAMAHRQNYTQQYSKNHSLRKISSNCQQARPKTAPIMVSNLAQAITTHKLMEVSSRKRPITTTAGGKKPVPKWQDISQKSRKPCDDIRKLPSGSSNASVVRKKQQQQQPQRLKSKLPPGKSPSKPCKICESAEDCAIPEQWQKLLNVDEKSPTSSSDGFRHLIDEIERIRSQLIARDDMRQISFNNSLRLINEIRQQIDSVTKKSGSFLSQLGPFQTAMVTPRREAKARKSVRSLRFEGGRIVEKDLGLASKRCGSSKRKDLSKKGGLGGKFEKKFEEGPLRLMVPLAGNWSMCGERIKF